MSLGPLFYIINKTRKEIERLNNEVSEELRSQARTQGVYCML